LSTDEYVPDSLKIVHREWIKETVRAASQNMSGGDYEDADETIEQAKITADELFAKRVIVLKKELNRRGACLYLFPNELSEKEKQIFDNLLNKK
jgi:hypothetical protein